MAIQDPISCPKLRMQLSSCLRLRNLPDVFIWLSSLPILYTLITMNSWAGVAEQMSNLGYEPEPSTTTAHNNKAKQKDELQELLFINHFSNKKGQTHQRPDRRTTSSYVQRHIHRAKRMQNSFKLLRPESPNTGGNLGQDVTSGVQSPLQNVQLDDGQNSPVPSSFSIAYPPVSRATLFAEEINDLFMKDCQRTGEAESFVSNLSQNESCLLFPKHAGKDSAAFLDDNLFSDSGTSRIFDIIMPSLEKECLRFCK